jgi:hypothetical protein
MNKRPIIIHYHFFKNAGTSVDHLLREPFPDRWAAIEADQEGPLTPERVAAYLEAHPEIVLLSSHTLQLPPPEAPNLNVFPVLFIRHPLDRVRSVYEFERRQKEDTEGSLQARQLDLPQFVEWRLSRKGDFSFRDFQAQRLAVMLPHESQTDLAARALRGLQRLPYVGLVEAFDASIHSLQGWLDPVFPGIRLGIAKLNVTQTSDMTLEERLRGLKEVLGLNLYRELIQENQVDLEIFRRVAGLYRHLAH